MSNSTAPPDRPLEPHSKALIIGASSGIGESLGRLLAEHGYLVALVARREESLNDIRDQINAKIEGFPHAFSYKHDVTHYEEVPELFQQIAADLGGLDLIVYMAASQPAMTEDEYNFSKDKEMIEVNTLGAMAWLGQAARRFSTAGAGHIVGVSSIAGERGRRLNPAYNSSKAALNTYLEALRNRLSQKGATVTTIKPGFVDTALLANASKTMWVISPEKAAEGIFRAIRRRKQVAYVPGRWRLVSLIITHIPSFIFRRLNI
ncbi:MAG: SDR family NAD(P)-dependent oxidoreductase [Anaerolineae bacterium]|nr:MAG: SDR family NAD(P)-dependent oxidoreductase [Anaerolineae bacterium]